MQNTNTQSICGHHNFRQGRERLSPFDFWFDWDFSRSLTSRSGSRDTNIQESDDWHHSSVRFHIVCRKGCSEFFIKQSVFEESSKCPIPTNKHPGRSISLSVAGELLNASYNQSADVISLYTWSTIRIFCLEKTNKVLHYLRISEGHCKQLQRNSQSTTFSLGGLIQSLLVQRQP